MTDTTTVQVIDSPDTTTVQVHEGDSTTVQYQDTETVVVATGTIGPPGPPGPSGGTTNLDWDAGTSTVTSDTGTDATLTPVDDTNPGLMSVSDKSKLDGVEENATADQTAEEIKTAYESNADTNAYTDSEKSKLDGIEANADVTDATNVEAAGAVMESDATTAAMGFVLDEDDMASDSDTKVPTQQSVKAYVDDNVGGAANAFVGARVTKSAAQSIATGTWVALTFDTETFDTDSIHDTVTNTSRLTVPTGMDGGWIVSGQATFNSLADGVLYGVEIHLNGSAVTRTLSYSGKASAFPSATVSDILSLTAGDYVELFARQDTGSSLGVNGRLAMTYQGA